MSPSFLCMFLTPWLFIAAKPALSQELFFEVKGNYQRGVSLKKLKSARTMADFCNGFPSNWISNYVSSELSFIKDDKIMKSFGHNDTLTPDQRQMLQTVGLNTEIEFNNTFMAENPVNHFVSARTMQLKMRVIPEKEAGFKEGYPKMSYYLYENAVRKITPSVPKSFQQVRVLFTVGEDGSVWDARLESTSGKPDTDQLILDVIRAMPKWNPAEDQNGQPVKQEFELTIGSQGC